MSADLPQQYAGESADGTKPGEMKDSDFFMDLYHCNEPEWTRGELCRTVW